MEVFIVHMETGCVGESTMTSVMRVCDSKVKADNFANEQNDALKKENLHYACDIIASYEYRRTPEILEKFGNIGDDGAEYVVSGPHIVV